MNDERRSRADALLGTIGAPGGGQLKVFLGAAPGVGKTFAMLSAARELTRQGVDVAVGLVETHGRQETASLLDGLDVLARRRIEHRGKSIDEMDLDALLARRPQLALVDELAHRNAPGSRHPFRYQDIEELLDAGIDVYTTLNIQHLESLNDLVRQLTGVRVNETVPDAFLDRARDLVLVDLPPRELIERLRQGKVYAPDLASSALQRFFSPANLTALRDLAVQQIGDRVDADLREQQTAHGHVQVPVRRRVLVAIDGREGSDFLVRAGRKVAERRGAPWTAVFVDTGSGDLQRQRRVDEAFALASRLGGDTQTLHGGNIANALLAYGRQVAVSALLIGRSRERPFARMLNRTLSQQLLRKGAHLELIILSSPAARARARRELVSATARPGLQHELVQAGIASLLAVLLAWLAERWFRLEDLSLVFMTAVVVVGSRSRQGVAVATAAVCFLAYNFLFTEPYHTFYVHAREDVLTIGLFLVAALICGRLASRLRQQVVALRSANAVGEALRRLNRDLAAAADETGVLRAGARALRDALGAEVICLVRSESGIGPRATWSEPPGLQLSEGSLAAATWAIDHQQPAGRFTDTLQGTPWWCLPMVVEERCLGAVALRLPETDRGSGAMREGLAGLLVQEVAQALARVRLVDALEASRIQGETERLRAALLASVSHDLRSPLSAIIGSAESLTRFDEQLSSADRGELAAAILAEGRRLDRYIQNLLDMTRLGHGGLKLERDWIGLDEILGEAVQRLQRLFPQVPVRLSLDPGLPLVYVHPALVEQALFNILENAARFSPKGEAVDVLVSVAAGQVRIDVIDRGPGIPEAERSRIFDFFYSVERGDRDRHGTGLGLTICQGMIGAHGGSVEALPGPHDTGTRIRVTLPLPEAPAHPETE